MDAERLTNDQHSADTELFYGQAALDEYSTASQAVNNTDTAREVDAPVTLFQVSLPGLGSTSNTPQLASAPSLSGFVAETATFTPTLAPRIIPRMVPQLGYVVEQQASGTPQMNFRSEPQEYNIPESAGVVAQYKRRKADDGNPPLFAEMPSDTFGSGSSQPTSTTTGGDLPSGPAFITIDQKPREDDNDVPQFAAMPEPILNNAAVVAGTSASSSFPADGLAEAQNNAAASIPISSTSDQHIATHLSSQPMDADIDTSPNGPDSGEAPPGNLDMLSDGAFNDLIDAALRQQGRPPAAAISSIEEGDVMQIEQSLYNLDLNAGGDVMLFDQDSEPERHDTVMGSDDGDRQDEDSDMTDADPLPESSATIPQNGIAAVTPGRTSSGKKMGTLQLRARHTRLKISSSNESTKSLKKALRDLQAEVDQLRKEKDDMASQLTACRQRWHRCKKHSRKLQAENVKHKRASHSTACVTLEMCTSKPKMTMAEPIGSPANQEPWSPFSQTSDAQRVWLDGMIVDTDAEREGEMIPRWLNMNGSRSRKREHERWSGTRAIVFGRGSSKSRQ
nr:hypothetical protein CFP56_11998 [Quercus suber]